MAAPLSPNVWRCSLVDPARTGTAPLAARQQKMAHADSADAVIGGGVVRQFPDGGIALFVAW